MRLISIMRRVIWLSKKNFSTRPHYYTPIAQPLPSSAQGVLKPPILPFHLLPSQSILFKIKSQPLLAETIPTSPFLKHL